MKEILFMLLFSILLNSCNNGKMQNSLSEDVDDLERNAIFDSMEEFNKERTSELEEIEPFGNIYVSYEAHPGNKAEFLQIGLGESMQHIIAIFYWTDQFDDPVRLIILEQNYEEGEISGITAKIAWPENAIQAELGIIENRANLLYADGLFHEFWIEGTE